MRKKKKKLKKKNTKHQQFIHSPLSFKPLPDCMYSHQRRGLLADCR